MQGFSPPTKQARFWTEPLLPGGYRKETHLGRGGAWMGLQESWVIPPPSQASRVTGPPTKIFRLGPQRAKLTFFSFSRKKSHWFSKETKCGQFIVRGYASRVQINIASDISRYLIQTLWFVVSAYIASCLTHSSHPIKCVA